MKPIAAPKELFFFNETKTIIIMLTDLISLYMREHYYTCSTVKSGEKCRPNRPD